MSDGIEAGARALLAIENDICGVLSRWEDISPESQQVLMIQARAAIEAYEAAQWVDAETCANEDGNEFISDAGWIVFWHDGSRNHWKRPGWYDVTDDLLTAKPCAVKRLRPLPEPPKSEGDGR